MGFGNTLGSPPVMCEAALRAHHCWRWCGGWQPQALQHYEALHPVPDWHELTELLLELRDHG
jgi:hypothetical protein